MWLLLGLYSCFFLLYWLYKSQFGVHISPGDFKDNVTGGDIRLKWNGRGATRGTPGSRLSPRHYARCIILLNIKGKHWWDI